VTAIAAQMRNNATCTRSLAQPRGYKWIGLRVFRFGHFGISRLPQCRDVIDVHSQT